MTTQNQFIRARPGAPSDPPPAAGVSQEIADSLLETRIRRKLLGLLGRAAIGIGVVASEGMVVLSGFVPAPALLRRALRVVRGIPGVEEVIDLLKSRNDGAIPREGMARSSGVTGESP